jgi:hypothetical protein
MKEQKVYQPYFLTGENRWVCGFGGNQSKAEVMAIINERNAALNPKVDIDALIEKRNDLATEWSAIYDVQQNARERAHENEHPNWYGEGSKYQADIDKAQTALDNFDIAHPEVLAEIRSRRSARNLENMWNN